MEKIAFIVNPQAGNGATGEKWPFIRDKASQRLHSFQAFFTSGPGDAMRLTRQHLREGGKTIICVGGDGTFNEVVNGFMEENGPSRKDARVGLLPGGTACDFCRTVRIPTHLDDFFDLIIGDRGFFIDLGCLHFRDFTNCPCTRHFHNIVSFGISGEAVKQVNRSPKMLGVRGLFLWSAVLSLCRHGKKRVRLRVDEGNEQEMDIWNIAIANGRYHGGGICMAPDAVIDDGLLHVTVIRNLRIVEALFHVPKLYNGNIGTIKQVSIMKCRHVEASSVKPVLLEVDGELPGYLPLRAEIIPHALFVIAESLRGHSDRKNSETTLEFGQAKGCACGEKFPTGGA